MGDVLGEDVGADEGKDGVGDAHHGQGSFLRPLGGDPSLEEPEVSWGHFVL